MWEHKSLKWKKIEKFEDAEMWKDWKCSWILGEDFCDVEIGGLKKKIMIKDVNEGRDEDLEREKIEDRKRERI